MKQDISVSSQLLWAGYVTAALLFGFTFYKMRSEQEVILSIPKEFTIAEISTRKEIIKGAPNGEDSKYKYSTNGQVVDLVSDSPYREYVFIIGDPTSDDKQVADEGIQVRQELRANKFQATFICFAYDGDLDANSAELNGAKLAAAVADTHARSPAAKIRILALGQGTWIALEALKEIDKNGSLRDPLPFISSLHLADSPVKADLLKRQGMYGLPIENQTESCFNYFVPSTTANESLGSADIKDEALKPTNFLSRDVSSEVKLGGFLGKIDSNDRVVDDGIMDLVAEDILRMERAKRTSVTSSKKGKQ